MSELFRVEVAEARRQDWVGRITLAPPAMGGWAVAFAVVTVFAIATIAVFGYYTRHVRADARLMPDRGLLSVPTDVGGTVTKVLVTEGQIVAAGTPIAELTREQLSDRGAALQKGMSQLLLKRESLRSDVLQQAKIESSTRSELEGRIALLNSQIAQIAAQTSIEQQRADTSSRLYERWRGMGASGVVSELQIMQQQDTALQIRAGVRELNRQGLSLRADRAKAESDLNQLSATSQQQRDELQRSVADIDRDIAQSAAGRTRIVVAPATGTVTAVYVNVGQTVATHDPVADVMPQGSHLIAELWLPSSSMGSVTAGDRVVLRYHPYPYQTFGMQRGTVSFVAQTPTPADVIEKLGGMHVADPRYRVVVKLESQAIRANGQMVSLRPGTRADADVLLGRRSLVDWLLDPIREVRSNLQPDPTERN